MISNGNRKLYPLTHPQKAIWMTEMVYPNTAISNIAATMKINENVDIAILKKAINIFIEINEGMRLRFQELDGQPMQYVAEYEYHDIDYVDFTGKPMEDLFQWDQMETSKPINLINCPLYYFAVFKVSENFGGGYLKVHHIISDAWSTVLTANKVIEYYYKLLNHVEIEPENEPSYIEYIEKEQNYIQSEKFKQDKLFWVNKFSGFEESTTLKTRKSKNLSLLAKRKTFIVPQKLSKLIREYSEKNKVSIFSMFLAALSMYIKRVTQKDEIIINTPVLNRSNVREKSIMGMFISSIPLKLCLIDDRNFKTAVDAVTKEFRECLRHQKFPFEMIQQEIREKHNFSDRLSDIFISFQNAKNNKDNTVDFETRWHFNGNQVDSLGIHISDREDTGCILLNYDYLDELYYSKEIEFIHDHVMRLLWHGLDNPDREIGKLEMVSEEEKKKILYEFNNTYADYPRDKTIHQLFEEQVARTPESVALVFETQEMTYTELNEKSNQLARRLRAEGVKPNSLVGLMVNRSFEMIVGILGILKAGGAYVPIDHEYPDDRIEYMLEDSNVTVLLTKYGLKYGLKNDFKTNRIIMYFNDTYSATEISNLENETEVKDIAYVIYTSGSTGYPKGIMIEHKSLNNLCNWYIDYFNLSSKDRCTKYASFSFDASVFEVFPSLLCGASLHIISENIAFDLEKINLYFEQNQITVSFLPTPLGVHFMKLDNKSLRILIVGGDKLNDFVKQNFSLYNLYGPTENTVCTTSYLVESATSNIPIGKPIYNNQVYILDKNNMLQPVGIPGELCISGESISRGYLSNPDLTNLKFIQNPFFSGNKLYKTGDLARWKVFGDIEFLGRIDSQVKIRGYRIELGEIESKLSNYPKIKEVSVIPFDDENGIKSLCV